MKLRFGIIVTSLIVVAPAAQACTCSNGGAEAAFNRSAAVFLGRVVFISPPGRGRFGEVRTARVEVLESLKGVAKADTVPVVFDSESSCNPGFRVARNFLIYADVAPVGLPALITDHCAGTKPLSCVAPDYQALKRRPPRGAGNCYPVRPSPARSSRRVPMSSHLTYAGADERSHD